MLFEDKVSDGFANQGLLNHLGAKINRMHGGECEIELAYRAEFSNGDSCFDNSILGIIADTAAGFAAYSSKQADVSVLTVEYQLNLLSPAKGELLVAEARIIKSGRTITVSHVDVFANQGDTKTLCAIATVTLMVKSL
jgi:uncharacterized protein (TIGR00369 family)